MTALDPRRAPLFEALTAHAAAGHTSFHVPGHKSGQAVAADPDVPDSLREDEAVGRSADSPTTSAHGERPYYESILRLDLTELTGLDDLHQAEGVIREAEELAADCFGAARTFFLVGGSTVGNLAMVLAVCGRGDVLLVQRNVHKSVLHGLMLAGAQAVFLPPRIDETSGIAGGVDPRDVDAALLLYPEARGLLVTNPNYYGMATDLRVLAELLHARGKPLLVDAAHGAHFGFHPELPPSALSCGADAVVQSTHKMLTAMTMGAMLHLGRGVAAAGEPADHSHKESIGSGSFAEYGDASAQAVTQGGSNERRIEEGVVARLLAMLQSSSPSYPLLASLDLARRRVHTAAGRAQLARGLAAAQRARRWLCEQPCYGSLALPRRGGLEAAPCGTGASAAPAGACDALDPFKVTVWDTTGTLNGYALQRELERRGCFAELATPQHALLAFGPASTDADADRLCAALADIAQQHGLPERPRRTPAPPPLPFPAAARFSVPVSFALPGPGSAAHMPVAHSSAERAAALSPGASVRRVPPHAAVGRRAAAMVVPYPPGIPVLYPGELVTAETAAYLQQLAEQGARFHGTSDGKLSYLEIID